MRIFAATRVYPVAAPPIPDGAVAVDCDRIVAVGPYREVRRNLGRARWVDLGHAALLPGLVNAHCHLELSWMGTDPPPGGDYVRWVRGLLERRAREERPVAIERTARAIEFMTARGTAAVGDVANETWAAPLLARSGLSGVVFHETYGPRETDAARLFAEAQERLELLARDPDVARAGERLTLALAPHAPHTTSASLLRSLAEHARLRGSPLSIHVAESAGELEWLAGATGPIAELFEERGLVSPDFRPPGLSPVALLDELGILGPNCLAVHGVRLSSEDIERLQHRRAGVVTCPRSNERLGVGHAPVPELLAAGVPVALGTDSLASAPDLDPFAEMAALRRVHAGLGPPEVLRIATLDGARLLGLGARLGSLEAGKAAHLVAVPLDPGERDPLEAVTSGPERVLPLVEGYHESEE